MPIVQAPDAPLMEASYRLLFECNPMPMWVYEAHTLRTLAANEAALATYGYSAQDLVELTVLDLHQAHDAQRVRAYLSLPVAQQDARQHWQHQRRDGEVFDVEMVSSEFESDGVLARLLLLRDVTERVRANAEAQQSRLQLSQLTQRLMAQEKALIKRLAQVLHDQLGQTVAAIRMAHETIVTLQGNTAPAPVLRLQTQMGALIGQAVRQVRRVLVDLRPPLLEEQGLAAALDNELRNQARTHPNTHIAIHLPRETSARRWPSDLEYAAFMVAREAIENALRHSGASHVSMHLSGTESDLLLEIQDNGSGFVADATHRAGHLGLLDMRERAHAVGADVTVDPGTPSGTRVRFHWRNAP